MVPLLGQRVESTPRLVVGGAAGAAMGSEPGRPDGVIIDRAIGRVAGTARIPQSFRAILSPQSGVQVRLAGAIIPDTDGICMSRQTQ